MFYHWGHSLLSGKRAFPVMYDAVHGLRASSIVSVTITKVKLNTVGGVYAASKKILLSSVC